MTARAAARTPAARGPEARVEVVTRLEDAESLRAAWDELADASGVGPFARPAYGLAWWRHLGRGRLVVGVVRDPADSSRLLALAPLHERRVGPVFVARWLGHGLGTIAELLVRPGHEHAAEVLWRGLSTPRRVLELVECRGELAGLAALTGSSSRTTTSAPRDRCPVAEIDPTEPLAHLALREHKSVRESLRNRDRRLERAGLALRFEVAESAARLDELLPEVRTVFDAAELAHPRQHLLRPPWEGFVLAYLRETLDQGRSVVIVGYLDDRPVNLNVALLDASTFAFWIGRYDPVAREYGPGNLMLRESFEWAARRGLARLDLLLGDADYKRHWSTGAYETTEVLSGTPRALALARGAERAASRLREVRR